MLLDYSIILRFLSNSPERTTILYLDNTSTLDLYLVHKRSKKVIKKIYKQRYLFSNYISGISSLNLYVLHPRGFQFEN